MRSDEIQNLDSLGISAQMLADRGLSPFVEARELCLAEVGKNGREFYLTSKATEAWRSMKIAAELDGENIHIVSAYRSIARQHEIIRAKLKQGLSIEEIIRVCAPPGYSEHHTGQALDLSTDGVEDLREVFETSSAFDWLQQNAHRFSFSLSYPRDNIRGYQYEPWHWRYEPTTIL